MKKAILYIAGLILTCTLQLNAQYRYVSKSDTAYLFNDETVTFRVPEGTRGNISWQKFWDNDSWGEIGNTNGQLTIDYKIEKTTSYRVLARDGQCNGAFSDTITVGYATDLKDLLEQEFSFNYLLTVTKIPVQQFLDDGITVEKLLNEGLPLDSLLDNNIPIEDLLSGGVTVKELLDKNISVTTLFEAKVGVGTLLQSGADSATLETAGLIGTALDQENGKFPWVKIGKQVWMARNLSVTHYRRGDQLVPFYTTPTPDKNITEFDHPEFYWAYEGKTENAEEYGYLYTWYITHPLDTVREICPSGWHVPSKVEFDTLAAYLGGEAIAGGALKETGTEHWKSPNKGATNASGFNALPGGVRNQGGGFSNITTYAYFWTSTEASSGWGYRAVVHFESQQYYMVTPNKYQGSYIRCIKD